MTMPAERTRALRWAGEFLKEIATSGEVSELQRETARRILRHYPEETTIRSMALAADPDWLQPESELEV